MLTERPFDHAAVHWIKGHLELSDGHDDSARHHFEITANVFSEPTSPAMGPQALSELALLTHNPTEARSLLDRLVEQTPLDDPGRTDRNSRRYVYEALVIILSLLEHPESAALVLGACDACHEHRTVSAQRDNIAARIRELSGQLDGRFNELRKEGARLPTDEIYRRIRPVIHDARRQGAADDGIEPWVLVA